VGEAATRVAGENNRRLRRDGDARCQVAAEAGRSPYYGNCYRGGWGNAGSLLDRLVSASVRLNVVVGLELTLRARSS